jgi:hypothetical protein
MVSEMAVAALDLAQLLKDVPLGVWVALSEGKRSVVAYGTDMQRVLAEAREKGESEPLILKVPSRQEMMFL